MARRKKKRVAKHRKKKLSRKQIASARRSLHRLRRGRRRIMKRTYYIRPEAHVTEDGALFRRNDRFYAFRDKLMAGRPVSDTAKVDVEARMKFFGVSRAQAEEEVYGWQP